MKVRHFKSNLNVTSSLSFAFASLICSIHDIEPIIAQKSRTLFYTLSQRALKSIVSCLESQFDCCIADRSVILELVAELNFCFRKSVGNNISSNASNNNNSNNSNGCSPASTTSILSWEFFVNRFSSVHIESQLNANCLSPLDISGINSNNANFQRKIAVAKFALLRSTLIKPIGNDIKRMFPKLHFNTPVNDSTNSTLKRSQFWKSKALFQNVNLHTLNCDVFCCAVYRRFK